MRSDATGPIPSLAAVKEAPTKIVDLLKIYSSNAARMVTITTTTSNSVRVKPAGPLAEEPERAGEELRMRKTAGCIRVRALFELPQTIR